jgi:hypothetical protein
MVPISGQTLKGCAKVPHLAECRRRLRFLSSRPEEFFLEALPSRVGDWRAGLGRSLWSLLPRPFVCECHAISTAPRFQSPPRGLWDLSRWGDFRMSHRP